MYYKIQNLFDVFAQKFFACYNNCVEFKRFKAFVRPLNFLFNPHIIKNKKGLGGRSSETIFLAKNGKYFESFIVIYFEIFVGKIILCISVVLFCLVARIFFLLVFSLNLILIEKFLLSSSAFVKMCLFVPCDQQLIVSLLYQTNFFVEGKFFLWSHACMLVRTDYFCYGYVKTDYKTPFLS